VLARGGFWLGVALCGVALGGCSGGSAGPVAPTGVGPAAKLVFTVQPSNAVAGSAVTPAVQVAVQDAQSNTVTTATTSITVTIGTNPGSGTLAGTTTVAAVNGVATFSTLSLNTAGTGYTLTATATALTAATSGAFNISVGAAAKLVFTVQPSTAAAGAAITPAVQVTVQDAQGNTVTTATTSITVAIGTNPASGTLSGTTTVAAVSGVATFSTLSLNKTATGYTLTASATGLTSATSSAFNISVGAAAKLVFTVQPSDAAAGAAITPAVRVTVQDAQGNTVTTATTSITVAIGTNPASGTLTGTTTVAAVSGVATFSNLSIDKAGTGYTLTASATGLTGATSSAFNIGAGAAAKLVFTVQPSDVVAGGAMTPAVQVAVDDAQGNTVTTATTSITLAIGVNPASGTLSGTTTVAAVNGVATFANLSINNRGTAYTLTASATTLTGATSNSFNIGLVFAEVSAGYGGFVCGVTPAQAAYCWGYNGYGQLGNGTLVSSTTALPVSGGLTFASVSAGVAATCGVTPAGAAYCWGHNGRGELGNGTRINSSTPVAVSGGLTFASVSSSSSFNFTCGVTTAGAAYCWGDNSAGELGNGTTDPINPTTTPGPVSGGLTFASVSAGNGFACGVTTGGAAYCWGANGDGALGNGTTTASTTPVAVSGGLTFASVIAGYFGACGVTTGGAAYCWGANGLGQLGNGTTTSSTTPVPVSGGLTFMTVSGGLYYFTCGATTAHAAYCWGSNFYGQFGNGTTISSTTPVAVSGGLSFASVVAGYFSACGVTTNGGAYCWGNNPNGELGNGTTTASTMPVMVR
jgi:alpha-tubulin suppressor-like RCC1 family protein